MKHDEQMLEELMRRDGIDPHIVPTAHLARLRAGLRRRRTRRLLVPIGIAASWLTDLTLCLMARHLSQSHIALSATSNLGYGNDQIGRIAELRDLAGVLFFFGLALLLTLGLQACLRRRRLRRVETSLPHPEAIIKLAGGRH